MQTVLIVVFDGVQSLDVTGPLEVFAAANEWCADGAARAAHHRPAYRIATASLGGAAVRTSSGLRLLPDAALGPLPPPDLLVIPGGPGAPPPRPRARRLAARAGRPRDHPAGLRLHRRVPARRGRAARRQDRHHPLARCAELAAEYPAVRVDPDPIFIKDGDLATSAGITAGIDLALALVEDDLGRDAALAVARALVVFLRRPGTQSQFSAQLSAGSAPAAITRAPPSRSLRQIAIPLFDRFTALDAVGPHQVLTHLPGAEVIFAAERARDVRDESGSLVLRAPASYADVPHPDIILVPGGPGQADQMTAGPLRDWLLQHVPRPGRADSR